MSDKIQHLTPIISHEEILPGIYLLLVEAPQIISIAKPGQFVMLSCPECILRRPLSIHRVDKKGNLSLLYSVIGKGTEWLSKKKKGEQLDILGPLGNDFSLQSQAKNLLLVAGRVGIAPLLFLADIALEHGHSVTLMLGATTASQLYPEKLLPGKVIFLTYTEDGSSAKTTIATQKGRVTDYVALYAPPSDQIFSCGPTGMYQSLKNSLESVNYKKSVQVSLEVRMGCGLGSCYGCSISTDKGMKKVCQDGPVFELSSIRLEEIKT